MAKDWEHATEGDSAVLTENDERVERPKLYKVLLHNDDYTTMEFVIMVLVEVFHLNSEKATRVMLHVHQNQVGVAGVYPYEIAETKVEKVTRMAQEHEFPLKCTMEVDES